MLRTAFSRARRLGVVTATAAAALGLSSCASSTDPASDSGGDAILFQPATESLAVLAQLGAFSTGAFEEAGLDVQYNTPIPNAAQAAQSVTTNADIAIVGSSGVLPGIDTGRDMVTVATLVKGPTTQITLRDDVIEQLDVGQDASVGEKLAAMKGLSLAMPAPGSLADIATREALRLYGVDADQDMTIRPITEPPALVTAAREGQVDGFAFSAPTSMQPVVEGYGTVWLSLNEVPELADMPYFDVVTSKSLLEERRDDVVAFVRVLHESAQQLVDDPDGLKSPVKDEYFPDLEQDMFDLAWEFTLPTAQRGLAPSQEGFDALMTMAENQSGELDVSFDDVYDLSVLDEIEE